MTSRKIARDLFISKQPIFRRILAPQQVVSGRVATNLRLIGADRHLGIRHFGVFNEFSKKIKGEVDSNQEFQQSVKVLKEKAEELKGVKDKVLKEKAEELKGVKEDLKTRTKQTTEQLYKHVDGVWTEAEATAKKVYANVEETISATKEEVRGSFRMGKEEAPGSSSHSDTSGSNTKESSESASAKTQQEQQQQSSSSDNAETVFSKFKSAASSLSWKVSPAFQKIKEAKPVDLAKRGYGIILEELKGTPGKRKRLERSAPTSSNFERSTRTDVAVLPSKQSKWNKKWEAFKDKMQGHPVFKRFTGMSEPVATKSQEIAEDIRERWETSDHPIVHKIQDINETVFGESSAALSFKEIRLRDPSFSLPEFVAEVQEVIRPVLNAFFKGDMEVLKKYCSKEVIERCKAEHQAFDSQGIIFDNKILHISEIEVRETKMMGDSPIIILAFQTQQVYCIRDKLGSIKEGGKDTIHTVYYAWAMQLVEAEELGEGAIYPIWKLREMQQLGVAALI
ncbi:mitochondrial import inner membrane translocase subunit TIM44-2 [Lycium ferocissimum]|uniref:mitochondrial import inner membrane translocase subunit TIM44-2 n=1 Tax=Lycium ferocissimum TaxID=112874 RepID=UPI0028149D55|nr:mitochondrial import inner membrane translocase subunit TIM44-2 [Lycium ferocissimum]